MNAQIFPDPAAQILLRAAALAALLVAGTGAARADSRTVDGRQLVLTLNSDVDVSIETDGHLHDSVRVSGDDISCLRTDGGDTALVIANTCGDGVGHLTLEIPSGMAVTLTQDGSGDIRVGSTYGRLVANLGGSGGLVAGQVAMFVLNSSGNGDVTVDAVSAGATVNIQSSADVRLRRVTGPLAVRQSGSGDLVVGSVDGPVLEVANEGSGDTMVGRGNLATAHARLSGSGDLVVAATVATADLQTTGGGDIRMAHVTGPEHHSATGSGSISLQGSNLERYGMDKLASLAASGEDAGTVINLHTSHNGVGHFFAGLLVLGVLFVVWRTVQRNGGWAALRSRRTPAAAAAIHPGVLAVRDTLTRLDGRLAQVEYYVTSREFDLQRKFRDLDTRT